MSNPVAPIWTYWSAEDKATALQMRAEDKDAYEIAAAVKRTPHAVRMMLQKLLMTPEKRERYLQTERRRYRSRVPDRDADSMDPRPTQTELMDRDRRYALSPRDLTAALMNDPPVGLSALERRT